MKKKQKEKDMKGLGTTHAPLIASEVGMGLEVGPTCLHLFFLLKNK